jgi:hypothetical protein
MGLKNIEPPVVEVVGDVVLGVVGTVVAAMAV